MLDTTSTPYILLIIRVNLYVAKISNILWILMHEFEMRLSTAIIPKEIKECNTENLTRTYKVIIKFDLMD